MDNETINHVLTFECKYCNHTALDEVMVGVTVFSNVSYVCDEGNVYYGEQANEDGAVLRYECEHCCTPIFAEDGSTVSDGESLRDALKFHANSKKEDT